MATKIINIKGTQCSGKSNVISNFNDHPDVEVFDVLDLWNEFYCINEDQTMNWERWEEASLVLPNRLVNFLERDGIKIVEHACNQTISAVINRYRDIVPVIDIELKIPNDEILNERAFYRGLDNNIVKEFADKYRRNYAGNDIITVSQERAIQIMNNAIYGSRITYRTGSALDVPYPGNKIIAHCCNDIGGWGHGFVVAISNKWPQPEHSYREWYRSGKLFELGYMQIVKVEDETYVANMIAQHGHNPADIPIRYPYLKICFDKLADKAIEINASVHMPRIGCGLAGGRWSTVEKLIKITLIEKGVDVYVYTLEGDTSWK